MSEFKDAISEIKSEKRDRKNFIQEPEVEKDNIVTEKFTGRLYPCKSCGLEKVKEKSGGVIDDFCTTCKRKENILKASESKLEKAKARIYNATLDVAMPDGSIAKVRDEDEQRFITNRLTQYQTDYDWVHSSDYGLLTKLVLLELQTNRISKQLTLRYKSADAMVLAKLSEEYRKTQADLGITRGKRVDEKEGEDASSTVMKMIQKFKEYRDKFPERFLWKCTKCGEINKLEFENHSQQVATDGIKS